MKMTNFNSTKVRLKPLHSSNFGVNLLFQFHKGSIKTEGSRTIPNQLLLFQFHKGSIKTRI